jgi:hypothetical protein
MFLNEAKELLKNHGYKVLNEEMYEKEYLDTLRKFILAKAEAENFNVDMEQLEAVMFEAYNRDMDLEVAKEKVWLAVYMDKDGEPQEIE